MASAQKPWQRNPSMDSELMVTSSHTDSTSAEIPSFLHIRALIGRKFSADSEDEADFLSERPTNADCRFYLSSSRILRLKDKTFRFIVSKAMKVIRERKRIIIQIKQVD